MRSFIVSTLATALLFTVACASTKKEETQAPAVIAAPTEAPAVGVPAVTHDGVSIVSCDKGKDHRTLDLRTKDRGCEAVYTKGGQAAVVAHGKSGVARCEGALKKIKQKLVAAGYACQ